MPTAKPKLDYGAPVAWVDLAAFDSDGTPFAIWPCNDCLPWHVEVIEADSGAVLAREWHAVDCPTLQKLTEAPAREP